MLSGTRALLPALAPRFALALLVLVACWQGGLDARAEAQVEAQLARALIAFGLARTLNGVISVAQGTTVAFEPAGIGVQLSPGEILDPVNDLVEQFSDVMLLASVSLGMQKLLLSVGTWPPLGVLLSLLVLAWVWMGRARAPVDGAPVPGRIPPASYRVLRVALGVALLLRFAVPLTALASEAAYRLFLQPADTASQQALELARTQIGDTAVELQAPPPAEDAGMLERTRQWLEKAGRHFDVQQRLKTLQQRAADMVRHIVQLIAVFTLQTVLFPLAFLFVVWRGARLLVRS